MKILPWTLFLLTMCAGHLGRTNGEEMAASALFDSMTDQAIVLVRSDELDSLNTKIKSTGVSMEDKEASTELIKPSMNALSVMEKLKTKNITPLDLFNVQSRKDIDEKATQPVFGTWLQQVVRRELEERNPVRAYGLLVDVSALLEIAYAGCFYHECAEPVIKIQGDYQTFMYAATRISYQGVKKTIEILRYVRAAVAQSTQGDEGRSNAKKIITATLPKVQSIIDDYEKLEKNTKELKTKADNIVSWSVSKNTELHAVIQQWREKENKRAQEQKRTEAMLKTLKADYDRTMKKLKDIETQRNTLQVEFMRLLRTPARTVEKCNSEVIRRYKTVVDTVTTSWVIRGRCRGFWFWRSCSPDRVVSSTSYVTRKVRLDDLIKRKCWTVTDQVHMQELASKKKKINQQIEDTRPEYLKLMNKIRKAQAEEKSMVSMIAQSIVESEQYKYAENEKANAIREIERVRSALALVETIFREAKDFWKDHKKFIENYIKKPIGDSSEVNDGLTSLTDDEEIAMLLGQKDNEVWANRIVKIGMNCLVYGRLASLGYVALKEGKQAINVVYTKQYDKSSRKKLLSKGKEVIGRIKNYLDRIKEAETTSKAKRETAYKAITAGLPTVKRD